MSAGVIKIVSGPRYLSRSVIQSGFRLATSSALLIIMCISKNKGKGSPRLPATCGGLLALGGTSIARLGVTGGT